MVSDSPKVIPLILDKEVLEPSMLLPAQVTVSKTRFSAAWRVKACPLLLCSLLDVQHNIPCIVNTQLMKIRWKEKERYQEWEKDERTRNAQLTCQAKKSTPIPGCLSSQDPPATLALSKEEESQRLDHTWRPQEHRVPASKLLPALTQH